jgi:hypothetical protein
MTEVVMLKVRESSRRKGSDYERYIGAWRVNIYVAGRVAQGSPASVSKRLPRMKKTQSKNADLITKDTGKPPYALTRMETEAVAAFTAAKTRSGPRLKVESCGKDRARLGVDHPDKAIGTLALMRAIGTTDPDFYDGLVGQVVNASREQNALSQNGANFMLSVVKGIAPRDQIEAMLAAQMAAVHVASMTFGRRLANVENIPQQDSAERAFNKLTRTFAAQMSALKEYRSKGEQKMTVQHVHVAEGGQAIVGNVSASAPGGGANGKAGERPHALGYAPGVEMPRQIEEERAPVPRALRSGT